MNLSYKSDISTIERMKNVSTPNLIYFHFDVSRFDDLFQFPEKNNNFSWLFKLSSRWKEYCTFQWQCSAHWEQQIWCGRNCQDWRIHNRSLRGMHYSKRYSHYFTNLLHYFQFHATAKRCKIDRSQCKHFNTFVLPDICKVFDQKNQIWTDLMAHFQPRAKCPIKASIVKIVNATKDYSLIAHLPLEGYTWIIDYKIFKPIRSNCYKHPTRRKEKETYHD